MSGFRLSRLPVFLGGVDRPTSRRKPDMSPPQVEKLIELLEQDNEPGSLAA